MAPSKILVVIGATGKQGGSVVNSILADPKTKEEFTIRGVTRDTNSEKAKALQARGVETVVADVDDKASLTAAFQGAHSVFAVTDFWAYLDKDREIQQGKNIADASKEAGIQHLVFSTLHNVTKATKGHLTSVLHFDSKAIAADYIRTLGIPTTFFQPGLYMSNFPGSGLRPGPDGAYTLFVPIPGSTKVPVFSSADDTGKWVKAILLNREKLLGADVLAATAYKSLDELVAEFAKLKPNAGKGARVQQVPREGYKGALASAGLPPLAQEDLTQMWEFFAESGYYEGKPLEEGLELLTEEPTTWEQFVAAEPLWKDLD